MKNYTYSALLALLCLAPLSAHADLFSATLDAGLLKGPASAPMQVDNTFGSTNGSLLLLFDLGAGNAVSTTLTAGQYVSGNNTILAAGGFNRNEDGTTNETQTFFDIINGTPQSGDQIALRWFPQITYAQYQAGVLTTAGKYFGTYNPAGGSPDGGSNWTVPSSGQISLNFFTTDSAGGGTQAPSVGVASFQVQGAAVVPEPSTYALLGMGGLALFFMRRRLTQGSAN